MGGKSKKHSSSGRLREIEDPGHRQLRQGYARPTQKRQTTLCNENFRQTEGKEKRFIIQSVRMSLWLSACHIVKNFSQ